jgi:aryl-alcohol dehydrogenase-like predicted oxidoreductase
LALCPSLLGMLRQPGGEQPAGELIQRAIPSSGEMLPVIGLGRGWSRTVDEEAIRQTIKALVESGGTVIDTAHGGSPVRELVGALAEELGIQDKVFLSTSLAVAGPPGRPPGAGDARPKVEPAAVRTEFEALLATFRAARIDLVQVPAHVDVPTHLAVLRDLKAEGLVRYIGVTDLLPPPHTNDPVGEALEAIMRDEQIDFVGFDYSVGDRRAEEVLLPLAQEREIGVTAYFPFDRSRIFQRAGAMPLPDWAAEFDAATWAQFFLKYVVSHPAVTVVRTGTSKPEHMLDNIGGGVGRLPDEATRKRMAELVDSWPRT